jgi:RimJ/RimL family protein N-acetyltransferase
VNGARTTTYAIRVDGHLDDHWSTWLGALDLTREPDGSTRMAVEVADQAQLHGILAGLRDIGVVLTELRATQPPPPVQPSALERPLHTRRLTLRPATTDDAAATWAYRRLESVDEWLTGFPAELDAYRDVFCDPGRLAATVIVTLGRHPAGPIIGDLMLRREDAWAQLEVADQARSAQAELGFVLHPSHTGHGYATEALGELLDHCFRDLGIHRVTATCFLADDASWRLLERVGMRRERHAVGASLHRSGQWLDSVGYALLQEEWSAR